MRVAVAAGLILPVAGAPVAVDSLHSIAFGAASLAAALLLLLGLWTPVVGVLAALVAAWHGFAYPGDWRVDVLLGTLGAALALLGPGAWSLDARLFGWKRVEIRNGNGGGGHGSPPV